MGDCPAPLIDDWGRSLMDDRGTSIIGDRGSRSYIACHKNSNSFERPDRATRRMNPLLSRELMQRRACGTESATSFGHPLYGRPSFSVSAGKLQQASKDQLLGRKQIAAPQDLRRNERSVEEAERVEGFSYLEAEIGSPLLARGPETGCWRKILCWRSSRLSDTLWAVTVIARTASPKPFSLKAPLQRCLQRFRRWNGAGLPKFLPNQRRLCGFTAFCGS